MYANDTTLFCNFNTTCNSEKTNSKYIYGNRLWKYYVFYVTLRKSLPVRRVWKISNVTQNILLPFIHNCHPIEEILEKRCINSSGRYTTSVTMHSIQIDHDFLYKTVIRL